MLVILALVAAQAAASASDARQLVLSTPQAIAEIDAGKMKGDLTRLAWSPDASEFYLQTIERDRRGNVRSMDHYVVTAASNAMKKVGQEPVWASRYWAWKSAQVSPGAAAFKISVDQRQETVRSTAAPTGGVLARGGTADPGVGTTVSDVASAADQSQSKTIYTLKLNGAIIGEWVNEPVVPGANFTWAPAPMAIMAFAKREGGPLMVLDQSGRKQELTGARSALFPAWSDDGRRIAWLERKEKKKYRLMVAEISAR